MGKTVTEPAPTQSTADASTMLPTVAPPSLSQPATLGMPASQRTRHMALQEEAKKILAMEDQKKYDEELAEVMKDIEVRVHQEMNKQDTLSALKATRDLNKER